MFNQNYAAVPQSPTSPGYSPIPPNQRTPYANLLPFNFSLPVSGETVVTNPAVTTPGTPYPLLATVPASSLVEGEPFDFLASGLVSLAGTGASTVNFALYYGNSMTLANNTLLRRLGNSTLTGPGKWPFYLRGTLLADSTSGLLCGTVKGLVGANFIAEGGITNVPSGANFRNDPVLNFLLTATLGQSNAANFIRLYTFALLS